MRILIDIGHPAHVHLYHFLVNELKNKYHRVIVTVKNIPTAKILLEKFGIDYIDIGKKKDSIVNKGMSQLIYDYRIYKIVKKYNIQIGIGTSITLAHISKITGMKSFIFDDDDDAVQPLFVKLGHPFADYLISPDILKGKRKRKDTVYYAGYHELAYLHPNRFTPDSTVLKEVGLSEEDTFFILRFNAFKAHHDLGNKGLSLGQKLKLVEFLLSYGRIFITTERDIESNFKQYKLSVSAEKIHSLLYYARMFIGDSQTMTSEASVLGTPAVRMNSFVGRISCLEEEEQKYGLTYGFEPYRFNEMVLKIKELLKMSDLKQEWQRRRKKLLKDKIDVTAFMVWFIENYPESHRIMKQNPDYQYRFK